MTDLPLACCSECDGIYLAELAECPRCRVERERAAHVRDKGNGHDRDPGGNG